jgi:predicted RNase H-like nuclease (RuvC/YqgF family)
MTLPGLTLPRAKRQSSIDPADPDTLEKRQRNNAAARKYRQKKIDRIKDLEDEVEEVKRERDELRIRLARQEAETGALREMLKLRVSDNLGS